MKGKNKLGAKEKGLPFRSQKEFIKPYVCNFLLKLKNVSLLLVVGFFFEEKEKSQI